MRNFIIGTDWWTDCDDAVALRIAARAHAAGEICIRGIGINACMEYSVSSLGGFLAHEGAPDIPLGIDTAATDFGRNPPYQRRLAELPSVYRTNGDAEDAARLYRRLIAAEQEKLEIIEIGYLQVISAVIESMPDDISPLTGAELIAAKVSKIWVMAGKWDEKEGHENNFDRNARSRKAGSVFCEKCPVPVTFLGWEVGASVMTGSLLKHDDPLHMALKDHGSENGRMSWDPMLVMMALIGDEERAGYRCVRGKASVDSLTGANTFAPDAYGLHRYVIKTMPDEFYRDGIDRLIG